MSLTLTIPGLNELKAEIAAYPKDIEKIIDREFIVFGQNLRNDALRNSPVDRGYLIQNIHSFPKHLEISIIVKVGYAAFQEFGTKAFAAAYISSLPKDWQEFANEFKGAQEGSFADLMKALVGWVARHGMPESAAYPIAKKILKKGIKAQPFLYPAFEKNKLELIKNLKAQLNAK